MLEWMQKIVGQKKITFLIYAGAVSAAALIFMWASTLPHNNGSVRAFAFGFLSSVIFCTAFSAIHIKVTSSQSWKPFGAGLVVVNLLLFFFGLAICYLLREFGNMDEKAAILATGVCVSIASLIFGRIWIFIAPSVTEVDYSEIPGTFYEDATDEKQVGGFRAWYHDGRYRELENLVSSVHKDGDCLYDFGCGGAEWNKSHVPTIGIDVNRALLEMGMSKKQLSEVIVAELHNTGLPSASADIAIISEVIEHLIDPGVVLSEIYRCLKPGGRLIVTVPWDTPFSLFFWLFNLQCFYRGFILGEGYYRQRCGHVNHFSALGLKKLIRKSGFTIQRMYRFRGLLLYSICSKDA